MKLKTTVLILLTTITIVVFAGCMQNASNPKFDYQNITAQPESIVYKETPQGPLKINIYKSSLDKPGTAVPLIMFFHGGAWKGGTPGQFHPHCVYFASRGIAAATAEYRLTDEQKTTVVECVKDAKSAIIFIRNNADRFGIDPDKIIAAGGSAGGHLALSTAMIEDVEPEDNVKDTSCVPNALVLFNPIVKLGKGERFGSNPASIDPSENIKANLPPMIIFHGTADKRMLIEKVQQFCKQMHKNDNHCELVTFKGKEHAFFNYGKDSNEPFVETVRYADEFMRKLGYLKGKPEL